jgi:hypothetical protein
VVQKNILNEKKTHSPFPLQVKWLVSYKQRIDGVMVGMLTSCVVVCDFHLYRGVIDEAIYIIVLVYLTEISNGAYEAIYIIVVFWSVVKSIITFV